MTKYLLRQRLSQCHQEDRPVNGMETDNILTNQMKVCGPEFLILLRAVALTIIADTGNVVRQCIQPYINNMLVIKVYRNSPLKGGSRYTQILQSR